MGRIRTNHEFIEARELIRAEGISSRREYYKWHDMNKPARIPRRPDRAYKKEWVSWNDFLGNNNPYPCVRKSFRPYKESRQFAHSLKLQNKAAWIAYAKTEKKPKDIPSRPDVYYQKSGEWFTWKDFLGYDVTDRIKALQEAPNVFFILRYPGLPSNVYKFGVTNGGVSEIKDKQRTQGFQIIKMYKCLDNFNWISIISRTCREYTMSEISNVYMSNNIFETMNDLEYYGNLDFI